jgi:hypothetical protein
VREQQPAAASSTAASSTVVAEQHQVAEQQQPVTAAEQQQRQRLEVQQSQRSSKWEKVGHGIMTVGGIAKRGFVTAFSGVLWSIKTSLGLMGAFIESIFGYIPPNPFVEAVLDLVFGFIGVMLSGFAGIGRRIFNVFKSNTGQESKTQTQGTQTETMGHTSDRREDARGTSFVQREQDRRASLVPGKQR